MSKKSANKSTSKRSTEVKHTVEHIRKIFPEWAKDDIVRSLEEHEYDMEAVIDQKLNGREEWTQVKKKKTVEEIKAQKRLEQRKANTSVSQRGGRGASRGGGRGGERVDRGGRERSHIRPGARKPREENTTADIDAEQISNETQNAAAQSTTAAVESEPAVPSKPSFADILKKSVQKEEPQPPAEQTSAPDEQDVNTNERRERSRPSRRPKHIPREVEQEMIQTEQETAPVEEEEEEEAQVEEIVNKPVVESPAVLQPQEQVHVPAAVSAQAPQQQSLPQQQTLPQQQQQQQQQQLPQSSVSSVGHASNLILPPGSTEYLKQGEGPLDLQFGSMGISEESSQQTQHVHHAHQPNYPVPPQMAQQFPYHYGWPGQQYGEQGSQNFFNQYGHPQSQQQQQQQQHRAQQPSGGKDRQGEKQDETSKQPAGYQQGSNKYAQAGPYPQMGSPQYGFPGQYGYGPYMVPNAMTFQGYPQQYMQGASGTYHGKPNLYGYQSQQQPAAYGNVPEDQQNPQAQPPQEYSKQSSGYPYGAASHQSHDQSKSHRGKQRRSDPNANPYGGYGGYPGPYSGFVGYGPTSAYPVGVQGAQPTGAQSGSGNARHHSAAKDQDQSHPQQQQQQQQRQPWNQQY